MKTNPRNLTKTLAAVMAVSAISLLSCPQAQAQLTQPFIPGNVLVERVGTGSGSLAGVSTAIFLDQYAPGGAFVSSQALPSSGTSVFGDTGNSTTEGFLSLNPYSTNVVLAGYNIALGTTTPGTAAAVPRAIATVDFNGNFTIVTNSYTAFNSGNLRSAATDGANNYWGSGSVMGIGYFGTTSATNVTSVPANGVNDRVIEVVGGNIYFTTGAGTVHGLYKISGTPVTTGNAATVLINTTTLGSTAPNGFAFDPTFTICYIADTDTYSTSAGFGGVEKWTFNGSAWVYQYALAPGIGNGASGLAVDWTTTPPTIYSTTANGTYLVKVQDSGAGTIAVTNATAAANTAFRSVSFAPTNTPAASLAVPSINGITPASQTVGVGGTATVTLSGFSGNPVASNNWYKVVGSVTNIIANQTKGVLTITNAQISDTASYFAVLTNSSGSSTSAVVTVTIQNVGPTITSITPLAFTNGAGSPASFTVTASGTAPFSYYWFKETNGIGGSTNLITAATNATLSFPATALTDTALYQVIVSNAIAPYTATSAVVSLVVTTAPPGTVTITPASITQNAGLSATFTATNTGSGPFTYLWYVEFPGLGGSTNLILTSTNGALTLNNLLASNTAHYQVVVTNAVSPGVTSSVVTLTVTNDPHIASQPSSTYGLLDGVVQFSVGVAGTPPTYQWYYADTSGNMIAPVSDGTLASGSIISGSATSTLTWSNLQTVDLTNFIVAVTNAYGGLTSSVASLYDVNNTNVLAFWDFNGPEFTNTFVNTNSENNPTPFIGDGTASAFGSALSPGNSPFAGSVDANNGNGFESYPAYAYANGVAAHVPPFSWGTSTYPVNPTNGIPANNKSAGVQFNVSTLGAKNIKLYYECRTTATSSRYYRLQYTTNQTDWVDYPSSTSFGISSSVFDPFSYDLTGIPGVVNNPNFGVRIAAEWQSTANYSTNADPTNNYIGVSNTYGTGGTVTYDVVTFTADAITNNNAPPTISTFTNVNMVDYIPYTINYTVGDDTTDPGSLQVTAVSLNPSGLTGFNPTFAYGGSGPNRTLTINPNSISQSYAAAPILITVTDGNGDSTVAWFTANVTTVNLPPTNSLTALSGTNTLANTSLTIPFTVGDDRTPVSSLTDFTVTSGNSTLVPNDTVNNLILSGTGTANPTLKIVPGLNELGQGTITVALNDDDTQAPKTTSATFPFMVRPNTNVIAIDYFNYNSSGSLDAVSAGYWGHLSGGIGQMQVSGGVVSVNTTVNTENIQALLLGAPYSTNSGTVLYSSFIVNMNPSASLPIANGSYFAVFNDASGNTANVEDALVAATNGAAPGYYRLGINNRTGAGGTNSQMVAMDLLPGSNYVVVTSLIVSNGVSTLWINPNGPTSPSVTDTNVLTTKFNIGAYEFRESGVSSGNVGVSLFKVGTTFDSVFPSPTASLVGGNVVIQSSDGTIDLEATPDLTVPFTDLNATTPYTNTSASSVMFYRFKP